MRRTLDNRNAVGLSGAAPGYVSDLSVFRQEGFAVITLIAIDDATTALYRLRDFAVRQVFAERRKGRRPAPSKTANVSTSLAYRLEGHYSDGLRSLDMRVVDQRVFLEAPGIVGELRQRDGRVVVDDLAAARNDIQVDRRARSVSLGGVTYRRTTWERPAANEELEPLVGEYGWQHNYIRIYERDGEAYARVEWSHHQKLERVAKDAYRFPDEGPYGREEIRFVRDERGMGAALSLSGLVMSRRDFGAEVEARSRTSGRFVPELLAEARRMLPPRQPKLRKPELVEVNMIDPSTKLDVRYSTDHNFMGHQFYEAPRFLLQKPAAAALLRAHRKLAAQGFGIALLDGYRPWYVTRMFWDAVPPESRAFVADPSQGSRHNRGCAADVTLFEVASGDVVAMPGRYDEVSSRSSPLYLGGTSQQRWRRDLLKRAMEAEGYDVYTNEWWHFDYGEWRKYPVMNVDFNELAR
jgi:D-alanyl-D-alanine dipeptidase